MAKSKTTLEVPRGGKLVPAWSIRALRNETSLGIGGWTIRDYRKGSLYLVPVDVGEALVNGGIGVRADEDAVDDEWFDQTRETDRELADRVRAEILGIPSGEG